MARIPDKKEHARRFAELSLQDRRAIGRAVNRGRAVEKRAHAVYAVGVARRQQRFWRWAWLLGPIFGLAQIPFVEFQAAMFNMVFGTLVLGGMAAYWLWRARQAETANLQLVERGRGGSPQRRTSTPSGHLPGDKPKRPASSGEASIPSPHPDREAPKPQKPRRRKRR